MSCLQTKPFRCHLTEVAYNRVNGASYRRSTLISSFTLSINAWYSAWS
jgi:hypothetical protein